MGNDVNNTDEGKDREGEQKDARREVRIFGRTISRSDAFRFVGFVVFFIAMIVICVLIWPYVRAIFDESARDQLVNSVRGAGPGGIIILLALQFVQVVIALIPGEVVQIAAGMIFGSWIGALIILGGCIVSEAVIFLIVQKLGTPFVEDMVSDKHLKQLEAFEESSQFYVIVFILFLIPGLPKDIFTYLLPLTNIPFRSFLLITNLARLPGIVLSTYAAAGLLDGEIMSSVVVFAIVAAIAIAALFGYRRLARYLEQRNADKGSDDVDDPAVLESEAADDDEHVRNSADNAKRDADEHVHKSVGDLEGGA